MSRLRVFYLLLVTLFGLLFLYQPSIEIYWQQTYHEAFPLHHFLQSKNRWMMEGEKITPYVTQQLDQVKGQFVVWNQKMIDVMNQGLGLENTVDSQTIEPEMEQSNEPVVESNPIAEDKLPYETQTLQDKAINIETSAVADPIKVSVQPESVDTTTGKILLHQTDKLFFAGDSLMQGVAPRVKRRLYDQYKIESIDLSKQSTGLSYPKAFDWPKVIEETLTAQPDIKLLVVFLGPNDPWDFPVPKRSEYLKFKSAEWEEVYRSRIERILQAAQQHHVSVIWLGAPCMRATKLHRNMLYLNQLYQSEVNQFGGRYIPTSELLGCSDKQYRNFITTPKGNIKARIDDGIHFTVPGQRILANKIIAELSIISSEQEDPS